MKTKPYYSTADKNIHSYMTPFEFAMKFPFSKPIHRLIMMKIVMSGKCDGSGERIIDDNAFSEFCCCTKEVFYRERNALVRQELLKIRIIRSIDDDSKLQIESARGYTILSEGK